MAQSLSSQPVPPFPEGLETIDLSRISLKGLLENNDRELDKFYDVCLDKGFFYLDLQDTPQGRQLWGEACRVYKVGQETLPVLDMQTKLAYKSRDRAGVYDMGYKCPSISASGEPKFSEAFNVPLYEMLVDKETGFELPPWLEAHRGLLIDMLSHGNEICRVLLGALEKKLQVAPGTVASLHRVEDPSNDFLRVLRYPATLPGDDPSQAKFPPHRDSVSVAMLFTGVAGLQILESRDGGRDYDESMAAAWRWVEPVEGHVIVNLGDALAILTNELLRSGFHRVVGAPGRQAAVDKYSVLLGYRPALTTPMRPLVSPIIPPVTDEQARVPVLSCEEWGAQRVSKVYRVLEDRKT
ncbi:hypothetical protein PspLS_03905 [Pyricularia sp. CBS 133598]|nr:hypothetical protein PspLS_03905 [Pyricularia sp. CBS 133598]